MNVSERAKSIQPSSTLMISAKAAQLKAEGKPVITFGVGEPDFDTPEHIQKAGIEAIQTGHTRYTSASGTPELRKAIAKKLLEDNGLTYDINQIVVSNGAKHALMNAFMAIVNEGDEIIIPAPYWLSYSEMVKIAGGIPVVVHTKKENQFMLTRAELDEAYTSRTKAVILTSPSNPTGMVSTRADLEMLADFVVEKDIFMISDEIYEKLIYDDDKEHISIASLNEEIFKRTIIINGVSKSYAMTGWRIGYAVAPLEVAKLIASLQSHMSSNPNSIAQYATIEALNGSQDCIKEMCVEFKKRRDYIYKREEQMPYIEALQPEGAFYLFVDVSGVYGKVFQGKEIKTAADLATMLLEEKFIAVVPCADFGMADYIRLSYANSMENIEEGMNRMEAFLKAL